MNLNLSSNLYTYAGTVSSDGKENEVGGGSDSTGGDKYLAETDYETDVVSFMKNKGTLNTIKYLCKDSNFTNSIYVHENDMTFGSKITLILSDGRLERFVYICHIESRCREDIGNIIAGISV